MNNFIPYTARTFNTVLDAINKYPELADKQDWFKRLIAGSVDVLSMMINATANNAYLRTCFTRQALVDICERMGYAIPPQTTSQGEMLIYFKDSIVLNAGAVVTFNRADLAAVYNGLRFEAKEPVTYTGSSYTFTNLGQNRISTNGRVTGEKIKLLALNAAYYLIRIDETYSKLATTSDKAFAGVSDVTLPENFTTSTGLLYSVRVDMLQGTYKSVSLGKLTSDDFPELYLPDTNVLPDTLTVMANNDDYTLVDTLLFSNSNDEHFQFIRKTQGKSSIRFGNGTYGKAPINAEIKVAYFYGGGAGANVKNPAMIKTYAGADDKIAGCINLTPFSGGSDEKNLETVRFLAAGALKSRDRFVTSADGEFLAMAFGGVALAKVIPNAYGILTAKVVAVAEGGGNLPDLLKTNLQTYLAERTVLSSIGVSVENIAFHNFDVDISINIKSDYDTDFVTNAAILGIRLFLDETSYEILNAYNSDGVNAAAAKVKNIYNTDLTADFYPIMDKFFDFLNEFGSNTFGKTIYESQLITFFTIAIPGIINIDINLAATFPISIAVDQISHVDSVDVTVVKV